MTFDLCKTCPLDLLHSQLHLGYFAQFKKNLCVRENTQVKVRIVLSISLSDSPEDLREDAFSGSSQNFGFCLLEGTRISRPRQLPPPVADHFNLADIQNSQLRFSSVRLRVCACVRARVCTGNW